MKIYIARHGETAWNREFRVCGRTDLDLTDRGIEQAYLLAQEVKKYNIAHIISSPLKRALKTSEVVAEKIGLPVTVDDRLIEQDYGRFEGVSGKDEGFLENKKKFAYRYPGGESMMMVAARVYPLLDEIREKYCDKNVLLICHGGVCRVINTYFQDVTNEEFFHWNMENAKLKEYEV